MTSAPGALGYVRAVVESLDRGEQSQLFAESERALKETTEHFGKGAPESEAAWRGHMALARIIGDVRAARGEL